MVVNLNEVLADAKEKHYAVGLFNVVTSEHLEGVLQAAEELESPLIIGTSEAFLRNIRLETVYGMIAERIRHVKIPVVVHFDHGRTFEKCMQALKLGFSSVMFDCSHLPYEENVMRLAEISRIAHAFGVTVEGELGCVEGNEDAEEKIQARKLLTNPHLAADFVERTGVDALAVSVGNAHGAYKLPPKLDFELIEEINSRVSVPLVLHGGSGLTDRDFSMAIKSGISKVNIFTEINQAQARAMSEAIAQGAGTVMEIIPAEVAAIRAVAEEKIRLFGSAGKA